VNDPEQRPLRSKDTTRSLTANTAYAIAGNGVFYACQLAVIALLAKFTTPEIQGRYFLGLAVATPVVLFFGLELRGAFVADVRNQFPFGAYYTLRWLMLIPAGVLLLGFLVLAPDAGSGLHVVAILVGVFLIRMTWSLAEVGWGTFQRRERLDLLAASAILRGGALVLPFVILLPLRARQAPEAAMPVTAAVATLLAAAATMLCFSAFDRPRARDPRLWEQSWSWPAIRALAWQTLPLGAVALIINLCDTFPRIFLERMPDGTAQLGYFGSLAFLTLAPNLVILQAATAAANRLSRYYHDDFPALLRLGGRLVALAAGLGGGTLVIALIFGHWLLRTLYTPEYAEFETELHIVVGAQCLALFTNIFGTAATQMRLFWLQVPAQAVTLAATVIAAILLIPSDPVRGAAWTAMVRAVVQLVLYSACIAFGLTCRRRILAGTPPSSSESR
jgi:O-antigen/teichoic acid export membrane protein